VSDSASIYIPTQWDTSVSCVLTAAGFHVTIRDRKLANGKQGREYSCTNDGKVITLLETPLSEDLSYYWVLGLSRHEYSAALLSARDALIQHGALDDEAYKLQSPNA